MSLFTRARRHVDMKRVKELREEKIKQEKIAEVQKQQEEILAELKKIEIKESPKYSNWRRELNETITMSTAGMGMVNYSPMGDADLADFDFVPEPTSGSGNSQTGNNYTFGASTTNSEGEENSSLLFDMNSEIYDTIVFDFVNSGVIDQLRVVTDGGGEGVTTYTLSASSGRKEVRLIQADRKKLVRISYRITRDAGGGLGTNKILNVAFQRRTPMNIVVALDDPRANSFIRGGLGGSEERRERLKDMLDAGNEYLNRYTNITPSQTSPGDIALDTIPYEPPSPGPGGYKPPGSYDPSKFFDVPTNHGPQFPSPNLPDTGPGRSSAPNKDTQVARINDGPMDDPDNIQWPRNNPYKKPQPGPGYKPPVKKAKKQRTMVAHYDPQGEVLSDSPKYSNWRRELQETITMSTNDIMTTTLPAVGDVDLEAVTQTATPGTDNSGGSDGTYSFGDYDGTGNGGFVFRLDTRKYDTLKFNVSGGNATRIELSVGDEDFQTLSSGTNTITISSANRGQNVLFTFNAFKSGGSGATGASISGTAFQRRTNISTGIRLDDPDANAFVRMGDMNNLSAEERKAKLKDMLDAGNEYLTKYTNITPSKTSPGDIELAGTYNSPSQIKWPRNYYPNKKSPPGPGYRPSGLPIGPQLPKA